MATKTSTSTTPSIVITAPNSFLSLYFGGGPNGLNLKGMNRLIHFRPNDHENLNSNLYIDFLSSLARPRVDPNPNDVMSSATADPRTAISSPTLPVAPIAPELQSPISPTSPNINAAKKLLSCRKSSNNSHLTDKGYGGGDTDCETYPPSDTEDHFTEDLDSAPDELQTILHKMEELNKMNEADSRSVVSYKSSSSGSNLDGSPQRSVASSSRHNSCQPDDDENIDLWTIWGNLVKSWEIEMKKRPHCVKELVRRGIPQHFRTIAWQLICGASSLAIHDQYTEYLRQNSPYEKVILRDIPRTYPELEFFKDGGRGQQMLFNVIKAYSLHDREVGYCQGSAFIAGQLLLQMPEEEAFAVFVKLMEVYRLRELYKPTMTELGLCMFQLECIVQEQMPDLYMHFNNMGLDTSMYASSWFLTLFTTTLPLDLTNRIMDIFLVDGMDAIFRVAIAILQQARIELLRLDMEGMIKYFQRDIRERYENDHELLFTVAAQITLNAKKMKKLEKDYLAKRTKEQEEAIELRRLRTENRLLRQRIDYLEHESSALADKLIRGQVDLATQADNHLNICHELNMLRDINSDAHRRLEDAYETIRELSSKRNADLNLVDTGTQVDDTTMIEHIHSLQQELIEAHTKKADLENTVRELKLRIQELESANKRLKESPPDGGIASIQEELIRVKMREAEASLSLKEMRQRLAELEQHWAKYVTSRQLNGAQSPLPQSQSMTSVDTAGASVDSRAESPQHSPNSTTSGQASTQGSNGNSSAPQTARARLSKLTALIGAAAGAVGASTSGDHDQGSTMTMKDLEDQLMGLRIREADAIAELKEMRQKVMELETQNHVCTNQLKRQDEELKRVLEEKEQLTQSEKDAIAQLKEEQRKLLEVQGDLKEKNVMQRLKYTEAMEKIADLKQYIAQLESKSAEKLAHAQVRGTSIVDLDNESVTSRRSGSYGDANSIASEEMSAFLADVTTKIPSDLVSSDSEGDVETETEHVGERKSSKKFAKKSSKATKENSGVPKEKNVNVDDENDSGLQLSDN